MDDHSRVLSQHSQQSTRLRVKLKRGAQSSLGSLIWTEFYLPVGGGGGGGDGAGFSQQAEIPLSPHFNVFKDLKASLGSATIA